MWPPDERGVDAGVVGGRDVGLVVPDEQRRLDADLLERTLDVVRRGFLPGETRDRRLPSVGDLEPVRQSEVIEQEIDGRLLVRGDDRERGVEMPDHVDVVVRRLAATSGIGHLCDARHLVADPPELRRIDAVLLADVGQRGRVDADSELLHVGDRRIGDADAVERVPRGLAERVERSPPDQHPVVVENDGVVHDRTLRERAAKRFHRYTTNDVGTVALETAHGWLEVAAADRNTRRSCRDRLQLPSLYTVTTATFSVPFSHANSPERLYETVAAYDLVITPDGPLASTLNRQLDRPHLGPFAIPPRRHAAGRRERAEDRLAFLELVDHHTISWKRSAYAIGNILQCWEHQGSHEAILGYDTYVDDATERAVERIGELDTTSMELTTGTLDPELDIAVIAPEMLTPLERSYLPEEYDAVELFTDEPFDLPPFRILDSPTAIVDAVESAITETNAENVGIVLDRASEYSPLVESALEAADIPFFGGPGFIDVPEHRTFLQLLRAAHYGTDTRISEIRPLLAALGIEVDVDHEEKRLHETDIPALSWLVTFCDEVGQYTYGEALTTFEQRAGCDLTAFREELATLGIVDEAITEGGVDELGFYLQSYEVPMERENEGVLLADAKSASYVGRDVVFFLGLDDGWTHSPPRRPWVDQDAQYTRNVQRFQLLLQSGDERHYLVQDSTGGSPVTPCLYFEELLDEEFERFSDLPSTRHTQQPETTSTTAFEKPPTEATNESVEMISQSTLSTYVNSPRDHYFSRLVDSPDRDYFIEGNLYHDFAEFYVNHPTFVDTEVIDEVVDLMCTEARSLVRSVDEAVLRAEYRVGLETIIEYLDEHPPSDGAFLTPASGFGTNAIAEHFDRDVDSPVTERWFEDSDLGIKGLIDLVHSRTHLLDFKSGSKKSARDIVTNSALDEPADTPNFQALLYLTYWRSRESNERLAFTFFHFLETVDEAITGDADLEDTLTTVTYYPTTAAEYVSREAFFDRLLEDGPNDCQKTLGKIDYDTYAALFDAESLPRTTDSDELIESPFGQTMMDRLRTHVGEYKYVTKGTKQVLRQIATVQAQNYFKTDLDAFEAFVDDRIAELNRRRSGDERFPIEGLGGEPNYRYVDNRDLLLEGDQ